MEMGRNRSAWGLPRPSVRSVTRGEIDRFWRRKRMEEEDHLLAAQKEAARLRARALTEGDYRRFKEFLWAIIQRDDEGDEKVDSQDTGGDNSKEIRVGIKDWWTSSKYAYLNQPAIKSSGENVVPNRGTCTYIPHKTCFFHYS